MQDVEEYNAVISGLERMPSSANGNPRYMVMLRLADGDVITARTMPDSMEAYGIREGQSVTARIGWHYGKVTIASLDDRTPDDYESRVQAYERQGMTRSDAQGVVDAEDMPA